VAAYFRTEEQELDKALQNIGVSPLDIDTVILTHLHWDHSSNNHLFPNARFIVQKKEYEHLADPETKEEDGSEPCRLALEPEYDPVDRAWESGPGISVILTPGHTPGSQCGVVDTSAGKYILAGDLVILFDHWEVLPRIPNAYADNLNEIMRSMEKVEKIGGYLLPGHDWEVFERKVIYP
jgi:glyoxylase-like metal-dependent hydrolase (beta-lactamase superfamily II)